MKTKDEKIEKTTKQFNELLEKRVIYSNENKENIDLNMSKKGKYFCIEIEKRLFIITFKYDGLMVITGDIYYLGDCSMFITDICMMNYRKKIYWRKSNNINLDGLIKSMQKLIKWDFNFESGYSITGRERERGETALKGKDIFLFEITSKKIKLYDMCFVMALCDVIILNIKKSIIPSLQEKFTPIRKKY